MSNGAAPAAAACGKGDKNKCSGVILSSEELGEALRELPLWRPAPEPEHGIERVFTAKNFKVSMAFINSIATIAEEQQHHPDIHLTSYRCIRLVLFTHSVGGVTESDVLLAKKFDSCPVVYSPKWLRENPKVEQVLRKS